MANYQDGDEVGELKIQISSRIPKQITLPKPPSGGYSVVIADPPWAYELRETDITHRARCRYPQMSIQEICMMPVDHICADDAYLLLWTTANHLKFSYAVMEAWGFRDCGIHTWVKTTKDGRKIRYGVGHYGRNCTEFLMVAKRGKIKAFTNLGITDMATAFVAPIGEHSAKPEEFYLRADRVLAATGGAGIELFARKRRAGWDSWGSEIESEECQ